MTNETVRNQVLAVEQVRLEAMLEGDVVALSRITGDDYVHVESNGTRRNKTQFLRGLQTAEYRFESFVIDENSVVVHGETAIVTGSYRNRIRTPAGLLPVKHARHMRIYVRRDGEWINVAHQATAISPA